MRFAPLLRRAGFAAAALCLAAPAHAHIVASRLGDFYAGALHPLTSPSDPLLWIAAGVLAATAGATRARWLVLLFPAGLLTGLYLGQSFGLATDTLLIDAVLMVVAGGLLVASVALPAPVLFTIVIVLALLRGSANAAGLAPDTNQVLFGAGFAAAGYVVITLTMGAAAAFRAQGIFWRAIAICACGGWVAAVGIMAGGYAIVAG